MKKIVIFLLFVFVLFGCQKSNIEPPKLLRIENNEITWSSVDGADHYILNYNNELVTLEENKYALSNLELGDYTFKIKVVVNGKESSFSSALTYTWIYDKPFENIQLNGNILSWNQIAPNVTYRVKLEYDQTKLENDVSSPSYELPNISEGLISINVLSYYKEQLVSTISLIVDRNTYVHFESTLNIDVYDIDFAEDLYLNGTLLSKENYTYQSSKLSIKGSYLSTLAIGNYQVLIKGETSYYFTINITQVNKPRIISNNEISFNGQNIVLQFEVYEGYIDTPSGLNLTTDDFVIDGNTLTIKASYVNRIIASEPNRRMLILAYTLVNGPYSVYGSIFISLQT